jgi:Ser/Thr protein kinase RdoA (MazF antagonist)
MHGVRWNDLPQSARTAVQAVFGPATGIDDLPRGIMPGTACRVRTARGDIFLKAVAVDSPAHRLYAREKDADTVLPPDVPAPRLIWAAEVAGWLLMVFPYIEGRRADLSPGSPDLVGIMETVALLNKVLSPCPWPAAPVVAENVAGLQEKAHALLSKPGGEVADRGMYVDALRALDAADLTGDTLLHYDLHGGNLRVSDGTVHVIDWAFACLGAAWIEAAMLVPRFIESGHTAGQAEALLADLPAWDSAPSGAVTGLAALWTLFREYKARYGPAETRADRVRAAGAGRAWLRYRTA